MLVEEKKADYVFIVKDNQPTLPKDIVDMKLDDFSPSDDYQDNWNVWAAVFSG